ncbi:host nuclease inhibitor protein [Serratia liquefaciens]|uniref:host nuclease inhibitor protein n=1 Tax=Serratia liquefaciens TaxID=614 RepID=UPI0021C8DDA6|nr:host nuclease inhibitor protein [Serratia liquefaciens]
MTIKAYAWASGLIEFGGKVPAGALLMLFGQEKEVKETIYAIARHSRTGKELLVPGVPEACNQDAAVDALISFGEWATDSYTRLIKGGNTYE